MSEKAKPELTQARAPGLMRGPEQPRRASSPQAFSSPLTALQQTIGNQAILRLLETGAIQAKLRVSQPGDADEVEADRVAEQVVNTVRSPPIHRKCACEGTGSPCAECESEAIGHAQSIHRKQGSSSTDLKEVHDGFLANLGPGRPLDAEIRSSVEPRFGHDFSEVRIHAESNAEDLAQSVNARAFTIGNNVVFAKGEYQPASPSGLRLLSHELTHVAQQDAGRSTLHRQDAGTKPSDPKPPATRNMANQKLTDSDKAAVTAKFKDAPAPGPVAAFKSGSRFVLHDTGTRPTGKGATAEAKAKDLEKKELASIAEHKKTGGTPVGEGPSSYITAQGTAGIAHPHFFEADRPTATEFERGNDLMQKKDRETNMQAAWGFTDSAAQSAAIASYLSGFALGKKDIAAETEKANKNLDPAQSKPNNNPNKPAVMTTAGGAVSVVCAQVAAAKSGVGIAKKGNEKELEAACGSIGALINTRKERISGSTNLELSAEEGSDCRTDKKITPFSPYPAAAYEAAAHLYLLAALEIGQFPEITTHFFLDKSPITTSMNRCDPRCWDLGRLYALIASILGHPNGTTYGVDFIPGTKWGTSTIWWHEPVCGPRPGSSGAAPGGGASAKPAGAPAPPTPPPAPGHAAPPGA